MEQLIVVAIIAVVYIIRLMSKLSSTEVVEKETSRGALDEVFPVLEVKAEEFVEHPHKQKKSQKRVRNTASVEKKASVPDISPMLKEPVVAEKKERFTIKSKSEAKKAIIYSEIFGRKYN